MIFVKANSCQLDRLAMEEGIWKERERERQKKRRRRIIIERKKELKQKRRKEKHTQNKEYVVYIVMVASLG